jgi:hypothetical protein
MKGGPNGKQNEILKMIPANVNNGCLHLVVDAKLSISPKFRPARPTPKALVYAA